MTPNLHSRSQRCLKLDFFPPVLYYNSNILGNMSFKRGMTADLCMAFILCSCGRFGDLDVDTGSQWIDRGKQMSVELPRQLSKQ